MSRRGRSVDELLALVRERARDEGRTACALPGVWFFRFSAPAALKRARSTTMYLGVALQGQKRVEVAGDSLVYDRMSYLVMRGETEYRAAPIVASAREPYLAIGIQLPPELVLRTLLDATEGAHVEPRAAGPAAFISSLDETLADALCRLVRALDDPRHRRVLAPLALREIVFRLLDTDAAAVLRAAVGPGIDRERIRRAMEYIEARALERLSVNDVARCVAMSPSHFAHRFKDIASVSPMRYQKHLRMERAREILLGERGAASEVAHRVGYASASHFTRDFTRHFGLTPTQYARAFERGEATAPAERDAAE